jgi:pimeloyl-ACP methyl ester carboxylesterase
MADTIERERAGLSVGGKLRRACLICASLIASSLSSVGELRVISIEDRGMAVYCDGEAKGSPTVVLIPAGGRTAKDWATIQPAVSSFARVCSYDHANFGDSGKAPVKLQSVDEVVDDLHAWLTAAGERGPFILVGHSSSGFHARRFFKRYPREVAGLVFVDSAHEEQALRLHELDPEGPAPDHVAERIGFLVKPGERLEWRTELPLIVLGRGTPFERTARDRSNSQTNRMTEEQFAAWDRIWREFQQDLAKRSTRGEFRIAEKSGHWIQRDQPELVIEAIRDVIRME